MPRLLSSAITLLMLSVCLAAAGLSHVDDALAAEGVVSIHDGQGTPDHLLATAAVARTVANGAWTRTFDLDLSVASPRPAGQFE